MTLATHERDDFLDAARAFALLLGVVFHASLSFMPVFIGWAVMDVSTHEAVPGFVLISHSFRMELFFMLAGYFSHLTFKRRQGRGFLTSRMTRLAIPLVVGWFILRPLLVSGWITGSESMRGDADVLSGLRQGFSTLLELPAWLLTGTHLWFLYYLLMITLACLLVRQICGLFPSVFDNLQHSSDKIMRWLAESPLGLLVVAVPTVGCLWFMQRWGVDTPDKSLTPEWPVFFLYAGFFIFGWMAHRQRESMLSFSQLRWWKVLICISSCLICITLAPNEARIAEPDFWMYKLGFMLSYALMMWSLVCVTLGICKVLFTKPNRVVRYVADASYWLYLIHLPVVIYLQISFADLETYWLFKWFAISAGTVAIGLVSYELFIRSTFVGALLNGKRMPRLRFTEAQSRQAKKIA